MRGEPSGPVTCSSFSVSSRPDSERTRPIPSRARSASAPASLPASEAVCETVAARAWSDRPILSATMGLPRVRAVSAIASNPRRSSIPSMCSPSAVTRGSRSRAAAISDSPVWAWLPAVTT